MESFLRWLSEHDHLSGWAQTFGAVVTMMITIVLWASDRSVRSRERADRSRTAALLLLPPLAEHYQLLNRAHDSLVVRKNDANFLWPDGPHHLMALWNIDPFPASLASIQAVVSDVGPAAADVQKAFFAMQRMKDDRRRSQEGWEWELSEEWGYTPEKVARATPLLVDATTSTRRALASLRALFDD